MHKVLEINDEESLKKENITIDNTNKEFDVNIQKLNNLKKTIENELSLIDKTHEKIDKEMTNSYETKREKLKKEENDLKEKLKTEVTKIKEQFEINLTEINNLVKNIEKLVKGIKSLEKVEKAMILTLSYVSNINKSQRKMRELLQGPMKNLKISYIEDESKVKYEEYYFNGIPSPKNIEFKEIAATSFKVFWKVDDIDLLNIDKKEIKYKVEIRKENSKDEFIKVYEGNENKCLVNDKIEKNTNYELRICSFYKDIISNWSGIHKIKTRNIDSIIFEAENEIEFSSKLLEWTGYKKMELLYRGTRDGAGSNIFHNKCDSKGPTICLCQNEKGNIFGGYASISWTSNGSNYSANGSFLFTLTNIHGTPPTKYPNTQNYDYGVYHNSGYGPTFGGNWDLYISSDYLNNKSSYCNFGYSYPDVLGKGNSTFSGDANTNYFKLKELEVFKVFN